jgi:hypothetical protein
MSQSSAPPPLPPAASAKPSGFAWMLVANLTVVAIATILFVFVVPRFTKKFKDLDAELPTMTIFVIELSAWWRDNWLISVPLGLPIYIAGLYFVAHRRPTSARTSTYGMIGLLILTVLFTMIALYLPMVSTTRVLS